MPDWKHDRGNRTMRSSTKNERSLTRRNLLMGSVSIASAAVIGSRPAFAADTLTVRLDWSTHGMHAPFFLAERKGWFKAADLDVRIEDGNGSTTTVQLIGAGQFDIGHAALAPMAIGKAKGLPVTSIAGFIRKGDTGVLVPRDKNWTKPSDLIGQKVIYTAGSLEGPFVRTFFEKNRVPVDKVSLLNVDASAKVGMYLSGDVDAAISTAPFFYPIAESKRPSTGILFADFGLDLPGFGLITHPEKLKTKGSAIKRFTSVIAGAWTYILSGHEREGVEAIRAQRPNGQLSSQLLLGQIEAYRPFFHTKNTLNALIGLQSAEDWSKTLQDLEEAQTISRGSKVGDYFVNDYIDMELFNRVSSK
jgi:NitT/TauT family transport system substrate-binding protein